jgi:hypothetical protein
VADPLRLGHEEIYYPGNVNFKCADVIDINKANTAPKARCYFHPLFWTLQSESHISHSLKTVEGRGFHCLILHALVNFQSMMRAGRVKKTVGRALRLTAWRACMQEAVENLKEKAHKRNMNPRMKVVITDSEVAVDNPDAVRGKKVVTIDDGPTLTHGGMSFGAGSRVLAGITAPSKAMRATFDGPCMFQRSSRTRLRWSSVTGVLAACCRAVL